MRECRRWAEENGYDVPGDMIFSDRGKSGRIRRRPGRLAVQQALEEDRFDVLVVFATSRLERNDYRIQQFVKEEIVERDKRAVFIMSNVDTDDPEWEMNLKIRGLLDSQQAKISSGHIRAAQGGLFLKGHVHGTVTYGYRGEEVGGRQTKAHRPRRKYAIDPETSEWVCRAFKWCVHDRLSRAAIRRRLNELKAPLPPRCAGNCWTDLAVKKLLGNPRYRGLWRYGQTEAVLLSGKDYVRQKVRKEPLQEAQIENLRIIDDETWFKAQELMANSKHNAGRRPVKVNREGRPLLLNGLLRCGYHDRSMVVGGGNGEYSLCPICRVDGEGKLYTMLNRRLALEVVCRKIAELLRADEKLVGRTIETCRAAAEAQQRPDPKALDELEVRRKRLTEQIDYVVSFYAETEEDRRENSKKVADLRRQRASLASEIARLENVASRTVEVPSPEKVRDLLARFEQVLLAAALGGDEAQMAKGRAIIEKVTGGKILVYQAGPREHHRGWLKGVFKSRVVNEAAEHFGVHDAADDGLEVEIEFRKLLVHEQIAEKVKKLWDDGLKYTEIAKLLGWNRNIVAKALAHWHEGRGLPAPDGRKLVKRLNRPKLAERIADHVMALVNKRMPIKDIAAEFGVSRNRVTEAVKIWHERRGLPVPDGRALRKLRNRRKRDSA